MTLRLRFACDVCDLLDPIIRGEVGVEGAELETLEDRLVSASGPDDRTRGAARGSVRGDRLSLDG